MHTITISKILTSYEMSIDHIQQVHLISYSTPWGSIGHNPSIVKCIKGNVCRNLGWQCGGRRLLLSCMHQPLKIMLVTKGWTVSVEHAVLRGVE
jgi:hypothetical protein